MDAKSKGFSFLSNEGIVKVPFFQRAYVWEKDNWNDLLEDLLNFKKNHFLGSVILKQQPTRSGEPKEVLVIDGQQRLTTLSILVKALYDSFAEDLKNNCLSSLRVNLFYKQYQTSKDYHIKINHSKVDREYFEMVLRNGIDNNEPIPQNQSNKVLSCYHHFKEKLTELESSTRELLFNSILDNENKMLVVIDLVKEDDEQSIFDTINSAGVRLSGADIIKNALFQRLIELTKNQSDAIVVYESTWEKTFLRDNETIEYWLTERVTGRLKRDNIEILLHAIAVVKGIFDPDQHTLSDLPQVFKSKFDEVTTPGEIVSLANEISEYGSIFREKIIAFQSNTLLSFNDAHARLLHILDVAQISTFHPFILFVCKEFKDKPAKLDALLFDLEKYVVRRLITNAEARSYNKTCKEFIESPDVISSKLETDEDVKSGLKSISNKTAAIILFWIELHRRANDRKQGIKELTYSYSLEHLMPQRWEEFWTNMPTKYDANGRMLNADEAKSDRYQKIYAIGNMTLLTSSLNASLRNYTYDIKMSGEGRKKGIKAYSDLSITNHDLVLPFDNGDHVWDENKIIQRTDALTQEALAIWR